MSTRGDWEDKNGVDDKKIWPVAKMFISLQDDFNRENPIFGLIVKNINNKNSIHHGYQC